jgi:hypothetical protein
VSVTTILYGSENCVIKKKNLSKIPGKELNCYDSIDAQDMSRYPEGTYYLFNYENSRGLQILLGTTDLKK